MSALASTSRAQLRYILESTFGVTPNTGNGTNLRMTGESLNYSLTKEESKEIRADRQISSAVTTDADAAGGINFELSYDEYDPFLEAVFMNNFTVFGTNGVGATFTADFTATTITASVATSGSSIFTSLKKGQWFRLLAPANANNGKLFKVSETVAPTSTVITLHASTPATVGSTVANCAVQTSRLSNGTVEKSFTLEKEFNDVGQFFSFRGMYASKLSLQFAAAALVTGSFDFMGKDSLRNTSTFLPGLPIASAPYDIMNGVRGVAQLWEGGAPLANTFVRSLSLTLDNNLRGQKAINNMGSVGIGVGDVSMTGQLEMYFANGTFHDKFLNDTYTSLNFSMQDTAGNGYVMIMPKVLLMSGNVTAGQKNSDVMATYDFRAFSDDANADTTLRKTVFIDRVGVAVT